MLKKILFYNFEKFSVQTKGPAYRNWGQRLFKMGEEYCGEYNHSDPLVKSLRAVPINNTVFPKLLSADWIAPNAAVIGDVNMGTGSSLWHSVLVRGDTAKVSIGNNTLVQDRCVLKSTTSGGEISIGDNVYVGANCLIDS